MFVIPESPIRSPGRIDWPGGVLLAALAGGAAGGRQRGLELGLDVGRDAGLLAASVVIAVAWIVVETRVAEPWWT